MNNSQRFSTSHDHLSINPDFVVSEKIEHFHFFGKCKAICQNSEGKQICTLLLNIPRLLLNILQTSRDSEKNGVKIITFERIPRQFKIHDISEEDLRRRLQDGR